MLSAWCAAHEASVLVTPSQIRGIDLIDGSMVVQFQCVCGAAGTATIAHRRGGRRTRNRAQVATL